MWRQKDLRQPKILIVDDEQEIVAALKHFLSTKGYQVSAAFSGEEALAILEKERADLILLDLMMPGLSGGEVARIIKAKYPSIKLIILTAYPQEGNILNKDNLLEAVFIKPIRIQELYHKLWELFSEKEALALESKPSQCIKARVLLLKARLLLLEANQEVYDFLSNHLKALVRKGESYEVEQLVDSGIFKEKLGLFKPDILLINSLFLSRGIDLSEPISRQKSRDPDSSSRKIVSGKGMLLSQSEQDILFKISQERTSFKEILVYTIESIENLAEGELSRLTQAVETTCLKNGLLEIKWVEI